MFSEMFIWYSLRVDGQLLVYKFLYQVHVHQCYVKLGQKRVLARGRSALKTWFLQRFIVNMDKADLN